MDAEFGNGTIRHTKPPRWFNDWMSPWSGRDLTMRRWNNLSWSNSLFILIKGIFNIKDFFPKKNLLLVQLRS